MSRLDFKSIEKQIMASQNTRRIISLSKSATMVSKSPNSAGCSPSTWHINGEVIQKPLTKWVDRLILQADIFQDVVRIGMNEPPQETSSEKAFLRVPNSHFQASGYDWGMAGGCLGSWELGDFASIPMKYPWDGCIFAYVWLMFFR